MKRTDELSEICRRHILPIAYDVRPYYVVVPEPYVPFIPNNWNGVLVLAEAQNLSKGSPDVGWLTSATSDEKIFRLGRDGRIAIQPWEDGSLKLAVEAALGIRAAWTAVSNAVPWSLVDEKGNNKNPTPKLINRSKGFWSELLHALKPAHIVTAGAIARRVITGAIEKCDDKPLCTAWPLPSPRIFSPITQTIDEAELLRRFPEVAKVSGQNPEWIKTRRMNKILFACLAVAAANRFARKENVDDNAD
jgi:hypothetical protein